MGSFSRDKKFGKRDSRSSGRSRDSRSSFRDSPRFGRDSDERREFRKPELQMHTATCARCGNRCEVPFRPSGSKPVYCSDCFRKNDNFEPKGNFEPRGQDNKKEFEIINEKLNRILEALGKD